MGFSTLGRSVRRNGKGESEIPALTAIFAPTLFVVYGQDPAPPSIFASAQPEAGRAVYENTCGQCHTNTLLGRKQGEAVPAIESLSEPFRKFIRPSGFVPPLAGPIFLNRWGDKSTAQLISRFQETVSDKFLHFGDANDPITVNLTAYVLQVNGARAASYPLTRRTDVLVNSVTNR